MFGFTKTLKKEIQGIIDDYGLDCSWWNFKWNKYWLRISYDRKLSLEFIHKFRKRLVWEQLCQCQNLTEDFMREYQEFLDWNDSLRHQKFSYEFVKELCFDKDLEFDIATFIKHSIITEEEAKRIEDSNVIHDRLEILDL